MYIKPQKIAEVIKTRTKYFMSLKHEYRIMPSDVYKQSTMLQLNTFFQLCILNQKVNKLEFKKFQAV